MKQMCILARKLRAKAEWDYCDHYYSSDTEMVANAAKREILEDIANLIDEAFNIDSTISQYEKMGPNARRDFEP